MHNNSVQCSRPWCAVCRCHEDMIGRTFTGMVRSSFKWTFRVRCFWASITTPRPEQYYYRIR